MQDCKLWSFPNTHCVNTNDATIILSTKLLNVDDAIKSLNERHPGGESAFLMHISFIEKSCYIILKSFTMLSIPSASPLAILQMQKREEFTVA